MSGDPARAEIRRATTAELSPAEIAAIRALLWASFGDGEEGFTEDDWDHSVGGVHFILEIGGAIVGHGSVVERWLHIGDVPVRTGYVEAVAVEPARQGEGLGTQLMREVTAYIRDGFEMGALGTGSHDFYERLGWRTWRGPTSYRTEDGQIRTSDDDGYVLALETPASPALDLDAPISCEWRPGDSW
jgi:aminoglycoside 2'-N-acetyltransferase I